MTGSHSWRQNGRNNKWRKHINEEVNLKDPNGGCGTVMFKNWHKSPLEDSVHSIRKPGCGMLEHTYDSWTWKLEAGRSEVQSQCPYVESWRLARATRSYFKKQSTRGAQQSIWATKEIHRNHRVRRTEKQEKQKASENLVTVIHNIQHMEQVRGKEKILEEIHWKFTQHNGKPWSTFNKL